MSYNPNGAVIYRGPSMLDGAPIVVIVTGLAASSRNAKTGDMLQTWIICEDVHPVDALKSGEDASICGACPHRPISGGACYVQVHNAPTAVWRAYRAGRYRTLGDTANLPYDLATAGEGRVVRLGSYGDPAAVPAIIWEDLVSRAKAWTGYTHQWRVASHLKALCMASADTEAEGIIARAYGWRTFRVRTPTSPIGEREFVCPASQEAGYKTNCATCKACSGTSGKAKASPVIIAHGGRAKRFALTVNGAAA